MTVPTTGNREAATLAHLHEHGTPTLVAVEARWEALDVSAPQEADLFVPRGATDTLFASTAITWEPADDTVRWVETRRIVGHGGNDGGWGQFTYRPDAVARLLPLFDRPTRWPLRYPIQVEEFTTAPGSLYEVSTDGHHRLALYKGLDLPYVPVQTTSRVAVAPTLTIPPAAGPLASMVLGWSIGDLIGAMHALWHRLTTAGVLGAVDRDGSTLRIHTPDQVPSWLALDPYRAVRIAAAHERAAPGSVTAAVGPEIAHALRDLESWLRWAGLGWMTRARLKSPQWWL